MNNVEKYLCPRCKGPLAFHIESQSWKCTYCFSMYTENDIHSIYGKEKESVNENIENKNIDEYRCSSCGAKILADNNTSATFCLYCKSPAIIKSKFEGEFQPKYIIPFKIEKKRVDELYRKWFVKKTFAPRSFGEDAKLTGLYVPFWLYDSIAKGGIIGNGEKVRCWSDREYDYTETKYYRVHRDGEAVFEKVPMDGLRRLNDDNVIKIEPFDYSEMVDFSMPYMAGFLAEKYDIQEEEADEIIEKRVEHFLEKNLSETTREYTSFRVVDKNIGVQVIDKSYVLMPIYVLINKHKGEKYEYLINGQTGKVYGNAPLVKERVVMYALKVFLISTTVIAIGGALFV